MYLWVLEEKIVVLKGLVSPSHLGLVRLEFSAMLRIDEEGIELIEGTSTEVVTPVYKPLCRLQTTTTCSELMPPRHKYVLTKVTKGESRWTVRSASTSLYTVFTISCKTLCNTEVLMFHGSLVLPAKAYSVGRTTRFHRSCSTTQEGRSFLAYFFLLTRGLSTAA